MSLGTFVATKPKLKWLSLLIIMPWLINGLLMTAEPTHHLHTNLPVSDHCQCTSIEWKWMDCDSLHGGKLNFANYQDHQVPSFSLLMLISWEGKYEDDAG